MLYNTHYIYRFLVKVEWSQLNTNESLYNKYIPIYTSRYIIINYFHMIFNTWH